MRRSAIEDAVYASSRRPEVPSSEERPDGSIRAETPLLRRRVGGDQSTVELEIAAGTVRVRIADETEIEVGVPIGLVLPRTCTGNERAEERQIRATD